MLILLVTLVVNKLVKSVALELTFEILWVMLAKKYWKKY